MQSEIKPLTGLRGLAAFGVAVTHINQTKNIFYIFQIGDPAVDLFFCLSGFTLCLVYGAGSDRVLNVRQFLVARFARVYPLYAIAFVLGLLFGAMFSVNGFPYENSEAAISDGIRQLLMVNALPLIGTNVHWDQPMWSLSIEAFCYVALFPFLFGVASRVKNLPPALLVAVTIAISIFAFFFVVASHGVILQSFSRSLHEWESLVRGICMFSAGWLAYLISANASPIRDLIEKRVNLIALAMILVLVGKEARILDQRLLLIAAPLLIVGLMNTESRTAKFLSQPSVHFLGVISYSLYLLHWPVMDLTAHVFPVLVHRLWFRLPFELAASIGLATLSYRYIEVPAREFIRSRFGLRPALQISLSDATDVKAPVTSPAGVR